MKIGIVGVGVVGSTLSYGFRRLDHDVIEHDPRQGTSLSCVLGSDLTFVCVPTAQKKDGSCDTSIVEDVVGGLDLLEYKGVIVLKSTIVPGTTDKLHQRHPQVRLAFCPEFLREKSTYSDFVDNHDVCVIGAYAGDDGEIIADAHGWYPKHFEFVTPLEAELVKYFSNTFNALRIIFANQFYDVCEALGADYQKVKAAVSKRASIGGYYLDCTRTFRAFGGSCLPKDVSAMATFVRERKIDVSLFQWILDENYRIKNSVSKANSEAAE